MSVKLGSLDIDTFKLGANPVDFIYLGSDLVWSNIVPSEDPIMADHTTYVASTGTISASAQDSETYASWKLRSAVYNDYWFVRGTQIAYLQYEFVDAPAVWRYNLSTRYATTMMSDWTLLGSNTGAFAGEETLLDTRSGITWVTSVEQYFEIENTEAFTFYRLAITGSTGANIAANNWQMNKYV